MIYQFDSRVRYSEVDEKRKMSLVSVINYFQDVTTFHSEDIGMGIGRLKESSRAWLLSAWQIEINRLPLFGEHIKVQTWPYAFSGFCGGRNFTLMDENHELLAYANSLWIYVDVNTGHPVKLSEEEINGYQLEKELSMKKAPRKISLPQGGQKAGQILVQKQHLDTNLHVNNGQYVLMAQAFLPDSFFVKQIRVQYCNAALLHDTIVPWVCEEEQSVSVALNDLSGKPYAVVRFE